MQQFKDQVVAITGAGSGIGRALAMQLGRDGARLALSDIDHAAVKATAAAIGVAPQVRAYALDVTSREAMFAHAEHVQRDFGAVQGLVNNAGASIVGTIEHLSIEEIEWQLQVNLWSVIYGTKAFLPAMLQQRQGLIVNISSVFGFVALPTQGAYNIAKFGVRALNECLWRELEGTGVRVVSVHPGGVRTQIGKKARRAACAGEAEDAVMARTDQALVTPPEDMAAAIVKGLKRGDRRIVAGHMARLLFWLPRLFPNRYVDVLKRLGA